MSIKRQTLAALALGLTLPSCSPTPKVGPGLSAQCLVRTAGAWTVRVTQSGGFTGMMRTIEITSGGTLHVAEGRLLERTSSGALTKPQMDQLLELVNAIGPATPHEPPASCADCAGAELQITSGGWTCSTTVEGTSPDGSGAGRLVGFVSGLGQLATAGKLAPLPGSEVTELEHSDAPAVAARSERQLPSSELRQLRRVASWTGDTLKLNVYNGTKWRVTRLSVRVSRFVADTFVEDPRPLLLEPGAGLRAEANRAILPGAVAPPGERPALHPGETGPFEARAGPRAKNFRCEIESASGFPPD